MAIPVIDIFAGPGGLGEGFCSWKNHKGDRYFKIALSIEKETFAHQTLTLRSFFRQFPIGHVPDDYYEFLKGAITLEQLYRRWPVQSKLAVKESWRATLGEGTGATKSKEVDRRIRLAIKGHRNWLLIGGPPCQAYSVVGRNRRKDGLLDEAKDERVGLYKQYLRILAVHNPPVFVMENVKGLLSAETRESPIFSKILQDLAYPDKTHSESAGKRKKSKCPGYKIYSLTVKSKSDKFGNPIVAQRDFVINAERHGIPQTRHRVILLGIRRDINRIPDTLNEMAEIGIFRVMSDLPRLRSGISKTKDNFARWKAAIEELTAGSFLAGVKKKVRKEVITQLRRITEPTNGTGGESIMGNGRKPLYRPRWFSDSRLEVICNHSARGHMKSDLRRYFFISCFGKVNGFTPQLYDLPKSLLPKHKNVLKKDGTVTRKFPDRFRVQLKNKPAKTITSHISQDGHYYIHYDPTQCRSLTVREAARIQTFPDNYYFCGPKTQQFIQVGNAVPPLLAFSIAKIVAKIFDPIRNDSANGRTQRNKLLVDNVRPRSRSGIS